MIEVLVAVVLVAILSAAATVGVSGYQRSLHQLEMDGIAKEIFVAAQNHLTMAESQGYLGRTDFGIREDGEENIFYMAVGSEYDPDDTDGVLNLMLPFGAIDELIRTGGSYVIRYQSRPAQVLDVFYAEAGDARYGHVFSADEYDALMGGYRGADRKEARSAYGPNRAVVGYYGGIPVSDLITGEPLQAPVIQIINQEKLYVRVTNPNSAVDYAALKLVVTGMTSGVSKEIDLISVGAGGERVFATRPNVTVGSNTFTVVLDDITAEGGHFRDLFCSSSFGENLIPGENIAVQAVAYNNYELTNVAYSAEKTVNSLFAGLGEDAVAQISNIRHLENLGTNISGVSVTLVGAQQTDDLSWSGFRESINAGAAGTVCVFDANGSPSGKGMFMPIDLPAGLAYNGGDCSIGDVSVNTDSAAGLFGTVSGGSVSDLELVNFSVSGAHAGALAGVMTNASVYRVLARNSGDDAALEIKGSGSVGGLVGHMSGGRVEQCAAALYVSSTGGDAGGLIGNASDATVTNSYSGGHTAGGEYLIFSIDGQEGRLNVCGANAGGLIGSMDNTAVTSCYSTCSASGSGATGGLVGAIRGGSVRNCYSTGLVEGAETTGAFVGAAEAGADLSDGNRYMEIVNDGMDPVGSGSNAVISAIDADKETYSSFIRTGNDASAGYAYDRQVIGEFAGRFYFVTVAQLAGLTDAAPFIESHYGDWAVPETHVINEASSQENRMQLMAVRDGKIRVDYDPNGGGWGDTEGIFDRHDQHWMEIDRGHRAIMPRPPEAPNGMIFLGWTTDREIASMHDFSGYTLGGASNDLTVVREQYLWDFDDSPDGDVTLYAVWSEAVTVTFSLTSSLTTGKDIQRWAQDNDEYYYLAKGGKGISARIAKGDTVVCPTDPSDYTKKEYHSFFRWLDGNSRYRRQVFNSEDELPKDLVDSIFDFNKPVLEDKVLYPSWVHGDVHPDTGEAKEIKVILKKINGVFDVLPGAQFTLRKENGELVENDLSSDANGIIFVGRLTEGTYYLYETQAPNGYSRPERPYTLIVTEDGVLVTDMES